MTEYTTDDLLPLSALQHLIFCPRQCALIYLEQVWSENLFTAEGRVWHDRAHQDGTQSRCDVRIATGVRLVSRRLGLTGQADIVEYHKTAGDSNGHGPATAVALPGVSGGWRPYPVEYKRGRPKQHQADEVQLCAQAICLEEMHGVAIPEGSLFYGATRRRIVVPFSVELRQLTERTAERLHEMISRGATPPPVYEPKKCDRCSLIDICRPQLKQRKSVSQYISEMVRAPDEEAA